MKTSQRWTGIGLLVAGVLGCVLCVQMIRTGSTSDRVAGVLSLLALVAVEGFVARELWRGRKTTR